MKPTVGRHVHVYAESFGVEQGPIAGTVIDTAVHRIYGDVILVRLLLRGGNDVEVVFKAYGDQTDISVHELPTNANYRWCWPPKETE